MIFLSPRSEPYRKEDYEGVASILKSPHMDPKSKAKTLKADPEFAKWFAEQKDEDK